MDILPQDRAVAEAVAIKIILEGSLLRELDERMYFPFFPAQGTSPHLSIKEIPADPTPLKEMHPGHAIKRLLALYGEHVALEEWLLYRDHAAIAELFSPSPINGSGDVSLFEAALMIDNRIIRDELGFVLAAPALFATAIARGDLDPRHPRTLIKYSENAKEGLAYGYPDMAWRLFPADLQSFSMGHWGRPVYTADELAALGQAVATAGQVTPAPDDPPDLVTPEPQSSPKRGRRLHSATHNMFKALGTVIAKGQWVQSDFENREKHPEIIAAVISAFDQLSSSDSHSKYREFIQAFLDEFP